MSHHPHTRLPVHRFGLVELLCVVAVLAVLAAILLPVLSKPCEKARRVNCAGNLKQIGLAALMYSGDYNHYFMNVNPWGYGDTNRPPTGNWQPLGRIQYVADTDSKVWACPQARIERSDCDSSNYLYYGSGLKDDNDMATATVIGFDASGNHKNDEWMNALFIDGHAEGAKPDGTKGWNRNTRPPLPAPQKPTATPGIATPGAVTP